MKRFLLTLFILFIAANIGFCTTNSYDMFGQKTGSYSLRGTTINQYDKYGQRTGSFNQTSNGYNSADDEKQNKCPATQ